MQVRTFLHVAVVVALAAAASACDTGPTKIVVGPVGPSPAGVALTASVVPQATFVSTGCAVGVPFVAPVNVVIVAARPVQISSMTLNLIGGANLGGPTVTFPANSLVGQFGSMHIPAGVTRTFGLRPEFVCSPHPWTVHAAIVFIDATGAAQTVNASGPLG